VTPGPGERPATEPPKLGRPVGGSRAYAAYALGLLTLINFFNYADRNVVFAVFEPLKRDLQLSDQQLGWIGSAYIVVLSLLALPLGVLGDLRSRRAVIAFGVGLWSLFTSLGGAVRGFWQLFLCRAMVGVGEAGYGPVSQALIAEYYEGRRRALAIGIYSVGMALGGVLGIWLGGLLAETYGWRLAFLWFGVPGFVLALLASQLREPQRRPPTSIGAALRRLTTTGLRRITWLTLPLLGLAALGAALSGLLALTNAVPSEATTAVFGIFVGAGVIWTVKRLIPLAVQRTAQAGQVAATAIEEFGEAATTVLRVPTLIWVFLGGALVTFAVNGLIAWAQLHASRARFLRQRRGPRIRNLGTAWRRAGGARRRTAGRPTVRAVAWGAGRRLRRRVHPRHAGVRRADPRQRRALLRPIDLRHVFLLHVLQRAAGGGHLRRGASGGPVVGHGSVSAVLPSRRRRNRASPHRVPLRPIRAAIGDAPATGGGARGGAAAPRGAEDG
jgi:MFS family permease